MGNNNFQEGLNREKRGLGSAFVVGSSQKKGWRSSVLQESGAKWLRTFIPFKIQFACCFEYPHFIRMQCPSRMPTLPSARMCWNCTCKPSTDYQSCQSSIIHQSADYSWVLIKVPCSALLSLPSNVFSISLLLKYSNIQNSLWKMTEQFKLWSDCF